MTFRQACREAERRLGISEEQAKAAHAFADQMVPVSVSFVDKELSPGDEEKVICSIIDTLQELGPHPTQDN